MCKQEKKEERIKEREMVMEKSRGSWDTGEMRDIDFTASQFQPVSGF